MKPIKRKIRVAFFSLAIALASLSLISPFATAQVRFAYAGDMKAKYEGKEFYIYIYCNKYEGDTCTSADGATRLYIPNPSGWLKMLVK